MLFARALMNAVRWYCPDAVSATMYCVEELNDLAIEKKVTEISFNGKEVKEVNDG